MTAFDNRDGFIWMDGKLVPWREANVHILSHALHYASSVFEGERAYNGRIFNAAVSEGRPFEIVWDGQVYEYNLFSIPKGAPHKDAALKFIAFATGTQRLADQAKWISYGPARKSSAPLVGLYQDGKTEMAPNMPTNPDNMKNALGSSYEFWADHEAELSERFSAWLAAS